MSAAVASMPPQQQQQESKSAKKKKAKAENSAKASPPPVADTAAAPEATEGTTNDVDGAYESPYLKELYKSVTKLAGTNQRTSRLRTNTLTLGTSVILRRSLYDSVIADSRNKMLTGIIECNPKSRLDHCREP